MLLVDTVLWFFVGVYLEAVLPKEFGQRRHPCFCFTKRKRIQNDKIIEAKVENSECFELVSHEVS